MWQRTHLSTSRQIPPRPPFYIEMQITSQIEGVTRSVPRHPGTADLFHTRYDFAAIESPPLVAAIYYIGCCITWCKPYRVFRWRVHNQLRKENAFFIRSVIMTLVCGTGVWISTQPVSNATQDSRWRLLQRALTNAHRAMLLYIYFNIFMNRGPIISQRWWRIKLRIVTPCHRDPHFTKTGKNSFLKTDFYGWQF